MARKRTILVTGASGYVAAQLLPDLRRRYALRLVDARSTDTRGRRVPGVVVADLADPDRRRYRPLFEGADAVLHLGYRRAEMRTTGVWGADPGARETFETELSNVRMAQNVYRSALDAGVRRVVLASSNHAADWYEHALVHRGQRELVSPAALPLSDNFYGWAKAAYELLGFIYASGSLGRKLEVVLLRIGAPRDVSGRHYLGKLVEQHVGPGHPGSRTSSGTSGPGSRRGTSASWFGAPSRCPTSGMPTAFPGSSSTGSAGTPERSGRWRARDASSATRLRTTAR